MCRGQVRPTQSVLQRWVLSDPEGFVSQQLNHHPVFLKEHLENFSPPSKSPFLDCPMEIFTFQSSFRSRNKPQLFPSAKVKPAQLQVYKPYFNSPIPTEKVLLNLVIFKVSVKN